MHMSRIDWIVSDTESVHCRIAVAPISVRGRSLRKKIFSVLMTVLVSGLSTVYSQDVSISDTKTNKSRCGATTTCNDDVFMLTPIGILPKGEGSVSVTPVQEKITNRPKGTTDLVQKESVSGKISVAQSAKGTAVNFSDSTQIVRILDDVTKGGVSAESQEAINGGQLFETLTDITQKTDQIDAMATTLGMNKTRAVSGYTVGSQTDITTVQEALDVLQASASNTAEPLRQQVTQSANGIEPLNEMLVSGNLGIVQQDQMTQMISVGANFQGGRINIAGTEGGRILTGLNDGITDNDAVTVGQVKNLIGSSSTMLAVNNTADYAIAKATGANAMAIGAGANASGRDATSVGIRSLAGGRRAVAIGSNSMAVGESSVAIGSNSRASANNSVALGANSVADRHNVVSVGSFGNERQITNVANGVLGTDAVNVYQLNEGLTNLGSATDQKIEEVNLRVKKMNKRLSDGVAAAMAMSALPQAYSPGANLASASISGYDGRAALAIGLSRVSQSGKWVVKLNGSVSTNGKASAAAGIGYQW